MKLGKAFGIVNLMLAETKRIQDTDKQEQIQQKEYIA